MAWGIGIKSNVEAVPWSAAPSDGLLVSGESIGLVLSLDSSSLQARAAAYSTTFILNTTSPTPTPHPVSQLMQFVGLVMVSAMPSAEHSNVTLLHNDGNPWKLDLDYETYFFGMVVMKMYQIRSLMFLEK